MQSVQLRLWNEELSLNRAFLQLLQKGADIAVLKELAKGLLFQRSFQEYKIEITDEKTIAEILAGFERKLKATTSKELDAWLEETGQDRNSLRKRLIYQGEVNQLKQIVISGETVKDAFLKRKPRLDRVLFALIRLEKESLAREIFFRIRDDHQDFGELAKQFSVGAEAIHGGLIGPKPIYELNTELQKHLSGLNPGEVTEPFTLDGKLFLIARLIRLDTAQLTPELEAQLRDELFEQWIDRQLNLADIKATVVEEATKKLQSGSGVKIS